MYFYLVLFGEEEEDHRNDDGGNDHKESQCSHSLKDLFFFFTQTLRTKTRKENESYGIH